MELNSEEKLEKALKLSKKANVSLEDARAALEACSYDLLDAMVYLEKLGKASRPTAESYTTHYEQPKSESYNYENEYTYTKKVSVGDVIEKFFKWCGKIIKIGNENFLDVDKNNENFVSIPLTLVVLLLVFAFWIFVPLLIVGLFCGFKYGFVGPLFKKGDVFNNAMNKASEVTETVKKEVKEEFQDNKKDDSNNQ